jgi:polysaccharide export outer membrane protein
MNLARIVLALAAALPVSSIAAAQESTRQFQVGDRILLEVYGDTALSDTFTVQAGPAIDLPVIGVMPLSGVKRTEVQAYLTKELERYLKEPMVRARALVRLAIEGEVADPGFYAVPADLVLSDAFMVAGGLTTEAKMSDVKIDRAGREIFEGEKLRFAVAQGKTIDDLGLRSGDRIYVPRLMRRDAESNFRILGIILTIPIAIYGIAQLFN